MYALVRPRFYFLPFFFFGLFPLNAWTSQVDPWSSVAWFFGRLMKIKTSFDSCWHRLWFDFNSAPFYFVLFLPLIHSRVMYYYYYYCCYYYWVKITGTARSAGVCLMRYNDFTWHYRCCVVCYNKQCSTNIRTWARDRLRATMVGQRAGPMLRNNSVIIEPIIQKWDG